MKNFVLIGAAGYIAPRHMKAVKETDNNLIAAYDINDSVGIMDSFFPNAEFFTEFEHFSAFVEDSQNMGINIDYAIVCSPNYLHLSHIKFALKHKITVICEKPLVLDLGSLREIADYEQRYDTKVFSILQLRLHPAIIKLRDLVIKRKGQITHDVNLTYLTSRGKWYHKSWKGLERKSGGVAANIGVHFFDMLNYIFGEEISLEVHYKDDYTVAGCAHYESARVKWFLSIDEQFLPDSAVISGKRTFRNIMVDGVELEFSDGFTDLHTRSYEEILAGNGFGSCENRSAIRTLERIKSCEVLTNSSNKHNLVP